jgi:hypothetical protein
LFFLLFLNPIKEIRIHIKEQQRIKEEITDGVDLAVEGPTAWILRWRNLVVEELTAWISRWRG